MASSTDLKQRIITPNQTTTTNKNGTTINHKSNKQKAITKRGLRSLTIAISLPFSMTLLSLYIASSSSSNHNQSLLASKKSPFWFPPSWALHLILPASSFLMGLSAWMVWADGGFHRSPTALLLYMLQILLTVLWDPFVFGFGATSFGLLVCVGIFGSMFGCMVVFRKVNPVASGLIKPCLAWIAFLFIVNLKLLFI